MSCADKTLTLHKIDYFQLFLLLHLEVFESHFWCHFCPSLIDATSKENACLAFDRQKIRVSPLSAKQFKVSQFVSIRRLPIFCQFLAQICEDHLLSPYLVIMITMKVIKIKIFCVESNFTARGSTFIDYSSKLITTHL